MTEENSNVCRQIKTVQGSLKNAEESFAGGSGTRGELDLMLAEAQLQHIKEKRSGQSFWSRQRLALGLAVLLIGCGAVSWLLGRDSGQAEAEMKPVVIQAPPVVITVKEEPKAPPKVEKEPAYVPPAPQEPVASRDEVRNLVRSAREKLNASR